MQLGQTIGILMGSNIGTTLTVWLLALSGISGESVFLKLIKPEDMTFMPYKKNARPPNRVRKEKKSIRKHILFSIFRLFFQKKRFYAISFIIGENVDSFSIHLYFIYFLQILSSITNCTKKFVQFLFEKSKLCRTFENLTFIIR